MKIKGRKEGRKGNSCAMGSAVVAKRWSINVDGM